MNLQQLLTYHYWFAKLLPMSQRSQIIFAILFALITIAGIIFRTYDFKNIPSLTRSRYRLLAGPLMTLGILQLVFLVLHIEGVPWFGQRITCAIIFLIVGVWIGFRIRFIMKELPKKVANSATRNQYEKYLPH